MPKLIVGLVGLPGCGKGTVAKLLQETYGARLYKFSTVLSDILERLSLDKSRENYIKLSEMVRHGFGEQVLAYALEHDAASSDAELVAVDGIRRIEDLAALEPLPQFKLVEVFAPPETRYERMKGRGEKEGEAAMTWEQFLAEEQAPTEITIPAVAARAQFRLDNSGSPEDLKKGLENLMQKLRTS